MKVVNENYITKNSIVDGAGVRFVVWFQGCPHRCPGCHNPETHNIQEGIEVSVESVKEKILEMSKTHPGVTFSGGDPMMQPDALLELVKYCKEIGLNVWVYTGFIYENLIKDAKKKEILQHIDVLVDGPFILKEKSLKLLFKGSVNQRLINVPKSLKENVICEYIVDKQLENEKKLQNDIFI